MRNHSETVFPVFSRICTNRHGKEKAEFFFKDIILRIVMKGVYLSVMVILACLCLTCHAAAATAGQVKTEKSRVSPGSSYYGKKELEQIYRKRVAGKIPYNFGFGEITAVNITDNGEVEGLAVVDDTYLMMPRYLRMKMESELYASYFQRYCRMVAKKQDNLHRIRKLQMSAYTRDGKMVKQVAVNPEMCAVQ
jgi:hypothetical protein